MKETLAEWIEIMVGGVGAGFIVSLMPTEKEAICLATALIVFAIIREGQSIKRKLKKMELMDSSDE